MLAIPPPDLLPPLECRRAKSSCSSSCTYLGTVAHLESSHTAVGGWGARLGRSGLPGRAAGFSAVSLSSSPPPSGYARVFNPRLQFRRPGRRQGPRNPGHSTPTPSRVSVIIWPDSRRRGRRHLPAPSPSLHFGAADRHCQRLVPPYRDAWRVPPPPRPPPPPPSSSDAFSAPGGRKGLAPGAEG